MNLYTSEIRQPDEVSGNPEAKHLMKFEYCGEQGYRKHVTDAIEKIDQAFPGVFKYYIYRDPEPSSRLECTIFLNSEDDKSGADAIVVHSKEHNKKLISDDYKTFLALIKDALTQPQIQIEKGQHYKGKIIGKNKESI
eukprot:403374411